MDQKHLDSAWPARPSDDERTDPAAAGHTGAGDQFVEGQRALRALDLMPEAYLLVDHELRVLSANRAATRALGLRASEILGRTLWDVAPRHWDAPSTRNEIERIVHGEAEDHLRVGGPPVVDVGGAADQATASDIDAYHTAEGGAAIFWHDVTDRVSLENFQRDFAAHLTAWNGELQSNVGVQARAESELRRLAAELSEADHRKDVFLATLAHELRNPLAPLSNGLHLMKLQRGGDATSEPIRAMMERQVSQLVRLVDDLLDVSRITQGKLELRKEPIDLMTVIEAAVETSRPSIERAEHELVIIAPDSRVVVDGDAARLAQVVSNLLHNAAKYTPRGGRIEIAVRRDDDMAVVSIRDNGIGIPPEMIGRVFEMFMQVDQTLERSTAGLGIGLSLAKGLLEMHGGTLDANSDGNGLGSEFVMRLPVAITVRATPTGGSVEDDSATPTARRRILVVDDNVDSANTMAQLLEVLGNDVRTAHDGEAAIAVAAQLRPDLVIMDLGMPRLNGYEAARRIREQPWGARIVMVALTGWGHADAVEASVHAGFDHHLVKPVDIGALAQLLAGEPPPNA